MSSVNGLRTAQAAKDKGNAAFKIGDFSVAIDHYTTAILLDHNDHTLPLNRAAAYLKLGKNEDAERDCTTVLSLSSSNVKALYRRGQARFALGRLPGARNDFVEALKIEPANKIIQDELKRINILLENKNIETRTTGAARKRRRVPITIVDSTISSEKETIPLANEENPEVTPRILSPDKPATDALQHVSSRSLKSQPRPSQPSPSIAKLPAHAKPDEPRTFMDAKIARNEMKSSRVGGGIFRASGDSTIFPTRTEPSSTPSSSGLSTLTNRIEMVSPPLPPPSTKIPSNLFEFSTKWYSMPSIEDRRTLILTIPPANLPVLFKSSLEPNLLAEILRAFESLIDDEKRKPSVREYMESFTRVPRFGTIVLFLSRKEKELVKRIWERLGVGKDEVDPVWRACF